MTREPDDEVDGGTGPEWGRASPGQVYGEWAWRQLRGAAGSGVLAAAGGSVVLLKGVAALRRGDWLRGAVELGLGGLLLAVAAVQRTGPATPPGEEIDLGPSPDPDPGPDFTAGADGDDSAEGADGDVAADDSDLDADVAADDSDLDADEAEE